jgi:hypothetical protein
MDQHLYKYLVLNKHLCIPQLGSFVIRNENAWYEEDTGLLHAPRPELYFTDGVLSMSEKSFFDFLVKEMVVDDVTAIKLFHDFSYQFRDNLLQNGSVELKGVGTLTKGEDGKIAFQATHTLLNLLPSVRQGEPEVVKDTSSFTSDEMPDSMESKDYWWAYAIVLFILGAGALLFYYS